MTWHFKTAVGRVGFQRRGQVLAPARGPDGASQAERGNCLAQCGPLAVAFPTNGRRPQPRVEG